MTARDSARKLLPEERALLTELGYEVRRNMNGGDVARPSYARNWSPCDLELEFVLRVGRERAAALDAVGRLDVPAARALRRELEST